MSACAYPTLVLVLIFAIYGVFLSNNLIPQIHAHNSSDPDSFYTPSQTEILSIMVVFHFLLSMLLLCFTLACVTSPGYIPLDTPEDEKKWLHGDIARRIRPEDEARVRRMIQDLGANLKDPSVIAMLKSMPVVERKKRYGYHRHCAACNLYKPDRTHHCRVCNRCILRMDHHCPWINNCVGAHNYKIFLLLLLYAILTSAFIMGSMFRRLMHAFRPINSPTDFFLEDLPVVVTFFLALFLNVALSMFFAFHINLVVNAMTTIELREKKNNEDPFIKHRFNVAHIKFDKGKWGNFIHVFGPWYTWLVPISPLEDGTYSQPQR
uniref:Palmitoyltransferase n=1 Tax=Amorphochlora amoebiformis TaxID=1561963 RepID=A0A7S0H4L6_9EUKA|mmetsp:Transcript_35226/g.56869  ORF Transcript_35226/g.56869 Transcript_35226/m.56869 type:complete len:321 (+) Transcript_35226:81-1043(+)